MQAARRRRHAAHPRREPVVVVLEEGGRGGVGEVDTVEAHLHAQPAQCIRGRRDAAQLRIRADCRRHRHEAGRVHPQRRARVGRPEPPPGQALCCAAACDLAISANGDGDGVRCSSRRRHGVRRDLGAPEAAEGEPAQLGVGSEARTQYRDSRAATRGAAGGNQAAHLRLIVVAERQACFGTQRRVEPGPDPSPLGDRSWGRRAIEREGVCVLDPGGRRLGKRAKFALQRLPEVTEAVASQDQPSPTGGGAAVRVNGRERRDGRHSRPRGALTARAVDGRRRARGRRTSHMWRLPKGQIVKADSADNNR